MNTEKLAEAFLGRITTEYKAQYLTELEYEINGTPIEEQHSSRFLKDVAPKYCNAGVLEVIKDTIYREEQDVFSDCVMKAFATQERLGRMAEEIIEEVAEEKEQEKEQEIQEPKKISIIVKKKNNIEIERVDDEPLDIPMEVANIDYSKLGLVLKDAKAEELTEKDCGENKSHMWCQSCKRALPQTWWNDHLKSKTHAKSVDKVKPSGNALADVH